MAKSVLYMSMSLDGSMRLGEATSEPPRYVPEVSGAMREAKAAAGDVLDSPGVTHVRHRVAS